MLQNCMYLVPFFWLALVSSLFFLFLTKVDHPFLIHRLKVEGNILVEAGRLEEAMRTFVDAAHQCSEDGCNRMLTEMMGRRQTLVASSQEDMLVIVQCS